MINFLVQNSTHITEFSSSGIVLYENNQNRSVTVVVEGACTYGNKCRYMNCSNCKDHQHKE